MVDDQTLIFANTLIEPFSKELKKQQFDLIVLGKELEFFNLFLTLQVDEVLMRIIRDRDEFYLEFANKSAAPELSRKTKGLNLWFDSSVLIPYINSSLDFSWFYDYTTVQHDNTNANLNQLKYIAERIHPYWSEILEVIKKTREKSFMKELVEFRTQFSEKSWKSIGWEDPFFNKKGKNNEGSFLSRLRAKPKNPDQIQKVTLGHYPEYILQAKENSTSYFCLPANIWDTLKDDVYRWAVNKKFIENVFQSESETFLATEVRSPDSYFARELKYIVSLRRGIVDNPESQ
jgi:hypothetical protein